MDGFDLGPSWFWPRTQRSIGALVEELGLANFCQPSNGDVVFERMSREVPKRYREPGARPPSMRFVGGTAALVRALAQDLPQDRISLRTRVTAMALTSEGVALTVTCGDAPAVVHTACKAIIALPPRLLEATVAFSPDQDPAIINRWRETPTWMAPTAKFIALYDQSFWRDAGLSGSAQSLVGPLAEMHDASTASDRPALFGFFGLGADQRAVHGQAALTRACLAQLARIFGPSALKPHATLIKDWTTDPLTATDRDRGAGAHVVPRDTPWVAAPWSRRLVLAGSETSPSEPGYLAGAIIAAELAVDETLRSL
jgi:monoamine oxidase